MLFLRYFFLYIIFILINSCNTQNAQYVWDDNQKSFVRKLDSANEKSEYNKILGKNVKLKGNINSPSEIKNVYRNLTHKYKVLGEIKSGEYKDKINYGASSISLNEAKLTFYTSSVCKNSICIITHIDDNKLSFEQQKALATERYGYNKIAKFFNIGNSSIKLSNKSNWEICKAIEEQIPLWGYYEEEAKKRKLDCNLESANNYEKVENAKLLEEERKRKKLEKEIAELKRKNKELQKQKKKQPPKSIGGSGSGFFISKLGHIITNEHVVKKCKKITIGDNIDRQVPAKLIEVDRKNDLALLRTTTLDLASSETKSLIKKLSTQKLGIEIVPLATAGLMRSDDVELGEDIVVAGFPYGDIFSKDIKVTFGNVNSTKGVGDDSSQFQIQAPVQIGNSGGPIYDKYGNIVGVVVAQLDKLKMAKTIGSLPENVNFGIKASTVKQFLNSSGLPTKWAERKKEMSNKDISQIASKQTVMVVCHR